MGPVSRSPSSPILQRPRPRRGTPRAQPTLRRARVPEPGGPLELTLELEATGHRRRSIPLPPGQLTCLEITAGFRALRHQLVLRCASAGRTLFHVLGAAQGAAVADPAAGRGRSAGLGSRLDSTGLARKAQAIGLDPAYALSSSTIARAFTAYQLSALIEETLPQAVADQPEVALILVADPLALYTEEDVHRQEGLILTERAIDALVAVAGEHQLPVLLVQPPLDAAFMAVLRQRAHQHVRLAATEHGHRLERPGQGQTDELAPAPPGQATLEAYGLTTDPAPSDGRQDPACGDQPPDPPVSAPVVQPDRLAPVEVAGDG